MAHWLALVLLGDDNLPEIKRPCQKRAKIAAEIVVGKAVSWHYFGTQICLIDRIFDHPFYQVDQANLRSIYSAANRA